MTNARLFETRIYLINKKHNQSQTHPTRKKNEAVNKNCIFELVQITTYLYMGMEDICKRIIEMRRIDIEKK